MGDAHDTLEAEIAHSFHACDHGPLIAYAVQLSMLEPASDEYKECIALVKKDLKQFAHVSDAEAARIASGAHAALNQFTIHVCGYSGSKDPVGNFERSPPLSELSKQHWLHATPEFVVSLVQTVSVVGATGWVRTQELAVAAPRLPVCGVHAALLLLDLLSARTGKTVRY